MRRIKLIPVHDIVFIVLASIAGGLLSWFLMDSWRVGLTVTGIMSIALVAVVVLFNYTMHTPSQTNSRRTDRK